MHLLLNRNILTSIIICLLLILVFSILIGFSNQLVVYADNDDDYDTFECISNMSDSSDLIVKINELVENKQDFSISGYTDRLFLFYGYNNRYNYRINGSYDISGYSSSYNYESGAYKYLFSTNTFSQRNEEFLDRFDLLPVELAYNETIKLENNSSVVELENNLELIVGSGTDTGFIEFYTENDMNNPYKIIKIDDYDLSSGTIIINVKNQDEIINPIYIKNKSTSILKYWDDSNEKFEFIDKLPSTYYINVNNVTMLDYTNYEEDTYMMTYNSETGTGVPTLQWASIDSNDLVEFGEKVNVTSFTLETGKKYYLKWINPDEFSNISVIRYSTPISPLTPDNPVLDSTFDDYFNISNPDGSSEEESIQKAYIDLNKIQDKVIYQNKSTNNITVNLSIIDNYDGDIYTEIQQLYADSDANITWQKVKSSLFNDYNNPNITIEPNQRIVVGLVDGLAKFTYPLEYYAGYELHDLIQGTDYEISIYENAISNNKDSAYSTITTDGSISYDNDFNLDEWNLGDDGLPDIPNDFNDKPTSSVPVIELPSMDLNSEDGALATIKSSMDIVTSMVSIMFDNPITGIFSTAFLITIPIAIFKFIRG